MTHQASVTEQDNGALTAECTCGWCWDYVTAEDDLATEAAREHEDEYEVDEDAETCVACAHTVEEDLHADGCHHATCACALSVRVGG